MSGRTILALSAGFALGACSPASMRGIEGVDGFGRDAEATDASDATAPSDDAGLVVHGDPAPLGFAVVASDYTSTSIALLDRDGSVLMRDFVHSGSATTGLVTALSGDVVLPTRSGDRGILTLLDGFRTDVITRIDPASGEVLGQLKTHTPDGSTDGRSYSSTPQDYVDLDASTAWVSRFEPNLDPDAAELDRGIDLIQVDPSDFALGTERIDLSGFNAIAERTNPDTQAREQVTVYARPSRMVRLGTHAVVGIARLSRSFDALGEGMGAWVDLEARTARSVELPGLRNCAIVVPVPDDPTRVAVACAGFFLEVQREHAGLAVLVVADGELSVERTWRAADDAQAPMTVIGLIALGASDLLAAAPGDAETQDGEGRVTMPATRDRLYRIDLASGEQRPVFEAGGRYVIGDGSFDPRQRLVLVPDASTDADGRPSAGVRRFVLGDDGELEALDVIEIHPVLAARQVKPL